MLFAPIAGVNAESAVERSRQLSASDDVEDAALDSHGLMRGPFLDAAEFVAFYEGVHQTPELSRRLRELKAQGVIVVADNYWAVGPRMVFVDTSAATNAILNHLNPTAVRTALKYHAIKLAAAEQNLLTAGGVSYESFVRFYRDRFSQNQVLHDHVVDAGEAGLVVFAMSEFRIFRNYLWIDITASDERIIEFFESGK